MRRALRSVVCGLLACGLSAARGAERPAGRIEPVGTNAVWLGEYPNTEERGGRVRLRNAGKGTLRIGRVVTACKCLRVDGYPAELAPGESGEVAVSVRKNQVSGAFEQVFYVESDDPQTRFLQFRLAGYARPLFRVACTANTSAGAVAAGTVWSGTFTVTATEPGLALGGALVVNEGARCAFTIRTNRQERVVYEVAQTVTFGEGEGPCESALVFPVLRPGGEEAYPVRLSVQAVRVGQ